jgi:predicted RNA methylase
VCTAMSCGVCCSRQVLLDIGAGQGLFSLAAAARGHRVIAMEASPRRRARPTTLQLVSCPLVEC